jgi:hypothetical protein
VPFDMELELLELTRSVMAMAMAVLMDFSGSNRIQEAQLHLPTRIDDARDDSDINDTENHEEDNADHAEPAFRCAGKVQQEGIRRPLYATTR